MVPLIHLLLLIQLLILGILLILHILHIIYTVLILHILYSRLGLETLAKSYGFVLNLLGYWDIFNGPFFLNTFFQVKRRHFLVHFQVNPFYTGTRVELKRKVL